MNFLELLLFGIALAMDCFSVSIAKGLAAKRIIPSAFLMALLFGIFQAGMPLIGFYAGTYFASLINRIAPWLALVLLGYIGGKMIWEHFHETEEEDPDHSNVDYGFKTLIILSIATSIDALATGLIFVPIPETIWKAVLIIGVCSTLFSVLGTYIGAYVGKRFTFPAELFGGIVLICIGLKIFIEGVFL